MSSKRYLVVAGVLVIALSPVCFADKAPKADIILNSEKAVLGFTETIFTKDYKGDYLDKVVKIESAYLRDTSLRRDSVESCYILRFVYGVSKDTYGDYVLYNQEHTINYYVSTDDGLAIKRHIEDSTKKLVFLTANVPCDLYFKIVNRESKRWEGYNFPVAELVWIEFKK